MDLKDKKVLVVGLARTGEAVARFLVAQGARVVITDMKSPADLGPAVARLAGLPVGFELGYHDSASFRDADYIVVSPGVPMDISPLEKARANGKPVIAEIELASRYLDAPILGITGTNGKTTTTTLAGEILKGCGYATFVGGNIGRPLIDALNSEAPVERVVVELSSFQLEGIALFRPKVAVLLNISEDHLDRYATYEEYIAAKGRIFMNMGPKEYAVLNIDDERVARVAAGLTCRVVPMSQQRELDEGIFSRPGEIVFRWNGRVQSFDTTGYQLKGVHNTENIMAALASTLLMGAEPDCAQAAVMAFRGLPHRMELVRTIAGVGWYEDSKATNVGSVEKALASFNDITLIAGGKDKGGSYAPLADLVRQRVRHLILIGEAKERMTAELGALTDTRQAQTLAEAVTLAADLTAAGGTVLFSPACSSFDMFRDYEDRAEQFKSLVRELPEKDH
jgi:UDP-N-acetylmuramoylalanine--D-glutamate ligase